MRLFKLITAMCCVMLVSSATAQPRPFDAGPDEATSISDDSGVDQALCSVNPETGGPDTDEVTNELLNTGAFDEQYDPVIAAQDVGMNLIDKVNQGLSCDAADEELTQCTRCSCVQRCCYKNGAIVTCCLRNGRLVAC
jgi:hypothetical protein